MDLLRNNKTLFFFIVGGTALRILIVLPALTGEFTLRGGDDSGRYHPIAVSIADGLGFARDGTPDRFDQPGYPLFVGAVYYLTGKSKKAVVVIQIILEAGIILLIFLIGRELELKDTALIIAVGIALLNPFLAVFANLILTEVLATFFAALAVLYFIRSLNGKGWVNYCLAGFFSACAVLTRADLVAVIGLVGVAVFFLKAITDKQQSLKFICLFLIAFFITFCPWMIRNYLAFGELRPLGGVFHHTRTPYILWFNTWAESELDLRNYWWANPKIQPFPSDRLGKLHAERAESSFTKGKRSDEFKVLAKERFGLNSLAIVPVKRTFNAWIYLPYCSQCRIESSPLLFLLSVSFWNGISILFLIGVGVCFVRRNFATGAVLTVWVAGRLVLPMMSGIGGESRYLLVSFPAVAVLAGIGLSFLISYVGSKQKKQTIRNPNNEG